MPKVIRFRDYERIRDADAVHRDPNDTALIILLPTEFNVAHVRRQVEELIDSSEIKRQSR